MYAPLQNGENHVKYVLGSVCNSRIAMNIIIGLIHGHANMLKLNIQSYTGSNCGYTGVNLHTSFTDNKKSSTHTLTSLYHAVPVQRGTF